MNISRMSTLRFALNPLFLNPLGFSCLAAPTAFPPVNQLIMDRKPGSLYGKTVRVGSRSFDDDLPVHPECLPMSSLARFFNVIFLYMPRSCVPETFVILIKIYESFHCCLYQIRTPGPQLEQNKQFRQTSDKKYCERHTLSMRSELF